MHLEQFFVYPEDVAERFLTLREDEARHIIKSKRKKIGDPIRVVDGRGNGYTGVINDLARDHIVVEKCHHDWRQNEPEAELTLALGLIKGDRFDWVIEKGTEIGISRFIPILSDYAIAASARSQRWRHIAIAAMKQCGRSVLPTIDAPMSFSELIALPFDVRILVHPFQPVKNVRTQLQETRPRQVLVAIGPEGGFSESELVRVMGDFVILGLGRRRLRSETAALVACTIVMESLGEFSLEIDD